MVDYNSHPRAHSFSRTKILCPPKTELILWSLPTPHQQLIHWASPVCFSHRSLGEGPVNPGFCLHMGKPGKLISETSFKGETHY